MNKLTALLAGLAIATSAYAQEKATSTPASYPGGEEALKNYLSANMKYPAAAASNCIEGIVGVSFQVNQDGSLSDFSIVRLIDPDLEGEALRLAKGMPAWQPATLDGKPVESKNQIQVVFSLTE